MPEVSLKFVGADLTIGAGRREVDEKSLLRSNSPHPANLNATIDTRAYTLPTGMPKSMITVPYVAAMIAVIVAVDVLIFRNHFWARLMVNIGIVLVFAAFYLRFLKHP